jgi:hypothetical protein
MAKLIYSMLASVDGYVADSEGKFDWAEPDEEVHAFVNDLVRPVGTHLYGRRLYEVMAVWEDLNLTDEPASVRDFAEIWRAADKVIYSRTLRTATTARTRIERAFDADAVRQMKVHAERDSIIGGPLWLPLPSRRGWWTSATSSLRPSSSEAASGHSPPECVWGLSCWKSVDSAMERSTCTIALKGKPARSEVM